MQIPGGSSDNEAIRFPADSPAGRSAMMGSPAAIEVEFADDVRPRLTAPSGGAVAFATPSATDLGGLNDLLVRYGAQRAEPSIPVSAAVADQARATALQRGVDSPHYGNLVTLHFAPDANVREIARELSQRPEIVRAVPVPAALPPHVTVADPLLGTTDQVNLDPGTGLEHQWYVFRVHADAAWAIADGTGVVIADVDWGVRPTHQDLAPNLDTTHSHNAYDGGSDVTTGASVYHGTGVLGLAGAAQNGVGMTGIAPAATLWMIQADSGPGSPVGGNAWASGIEYVRTADSGGRPKIINLEVQTGAYGNYEMVPSVNAAIRTAIASGVVVCVAAGNGNRDASLDDGGVAIPETGSILVAATAYDSSANPRASFSNWGDRIIVAAPGDASHDVTCNSTSDTAYRNGFGGTSGATPKVAATAALMLSVNPQLSHTEIRDILVATGSAVTSDPGRPAGVFLDAQAAVQEAQRRVGRAVFLSGTASVQQDALGRQQLFIRGRPEAMLSDIFQIGQSAANSGWTDWIGHGHGFESGPDPAVGQNQDGRLEVFGVAPGRLVHKWETSPAAGWVANWAELVAGSSGTPTVGRNADGRLEVFSVWDDGALHHVWQTAPNAGWSAGASLGGTFTFPTARAVVGTSPDGRQEVFVVAADGTVSHVYQVAPNGGWSGWLSHGGGVRGDLSIGTNADGRLELFALGTDGQTWYLRQIAPGSAWSAWVPWAGATLTSGPAVGRNLDGRLEVFAVGTDGSIWHAWQTAPNGGWSGWTNSGGPASGFTSDSPAVAANADGRLEVFAVGSDRDRYHVGQTAPNGGWSHWLTFGRPTL
ncbi:MAG: hypothetical protein NVSMB2_16880 [Chloroflexota bacterium]